MSTAEMIKKKIGSSSVAVLGLGVSNAPLAELILECGNRITVYDKRSPAELGEHAMSLAERGVRFVSGAPYPEAIAEDVIFRSPGIRPDIPCISDAVARGAVLTSEMELFLELTPTKVLGITGSDGKTTTTTLSYKLLESALANTDRKVFVGGNIGTPLLSEVGNMTDRDVCVLELSSFQLFTAERSPQRAVITNISPNHLDWHRGMEEYISAKENIFRHGAERLITNANDATCMSLANGTDIPIELFSARLPLDSMLKICPHADAVIYLNGNTVCRYTKGTSEDLLDIRDIKIPGVHNIENYMAAIALTYGEVGKNDIRTLARSFSGVEHRLELVRELDGVKYYNSSIDSSPSRTAAALSALTERPIVICGGYDKKIPLAPLANALIERASAVVLTGATAEAIYKELADLGADANMDIRIEHDFEQAVILARSIARSGDTVLLSPACASFDAFRNFMERGDTFKRIVNEFK